MWHLQRKNMRSRNLLWLKLCSISLLLHSIFLIGLFIIYKDTQYISLLAVNKTIDYSVPVVFKPYVIENTTQRINIAEQIAATPQPKKIIASQAIITQKPISKQKTNVIKSSKESSTQVSDKKSIKHIKKEEKKERVIKQYKDIITEEIHPQNDIQDKVLQSNSLNAYTHNNYKEVEILRCAAQLQKELINKWQPPIGVASACSCEVTFFVNYKGGIEQIKINKSSDVMIFDISARQALHNTQMPHWTYGKSLTIVFQ